MNTNEKYPCTMNLLSLNSVCNCKNVELYSPIDREDFNLDKLLDEANKVLQYLRDADAAMRYVEHIIDRCPAAESLVLIDNDSDSKIQFFELYEAAVAEHI